MKRDTVASNSVDDEKICPEVTLGKASSIGTAFAKAVLSKCLRQFAARDQHVKNVFECLGLEFRMLASSAVVALEARQND
jgi:hypothetical protein